MVEVRFEKSVWLRASVLPWAGFEKSVWLWASVLPWAEFSECWARAEEAVVHSIPTVRNPRVRILR